MTDAVGAAATRQWHWRVDEATARIPAAGPLLYANIFRHGTMSLEIYAPRGTDPQEPHAQDELYFVHRGSGQFVNGARRHPFEAGDAMFVPAGVAHRFEGFSDDLVVWVVFWGRDGGEAEIQWEVEARPAVPWNWSVAQALAQIPADAALRSTKLFDHGTMTLKLYAPRGHDPQTPHRQDELYVVARGSGRFLNDGRRHPFGPGDALFVPAGVEHRFEDFTDDLAVWVVFYGVEGGEAREAGPDLTGN